MFELLLTCKGLLKIDTICIDNTVFKLHYKATMILLITFSLLVTSKQYIGDPIDCLADDTKVPLKVLDTYCWIHTTFTLPSKFTGVIGTDLAHHGIGPENKNTDTRTYHKYYQWVGFVLFFQAALFYLPRYIWKTWESGRIKMLVLDLNYPIISKECKHDRKKLLVEYFTTNLHTQNIYAYRFFICEIFNFINVIMQIYLMDIFIGGEFTAYGSNVLSISNTPSEVRNDYMNIVFPKVTKCEFHKYGSTGGIENIDALCVLPVNILNEKIYIFLWFWFILLSVISGIGLIWRTLIIYLPKFRFMILKVQSKLSPVHQVELIANKCNVGDWFVLYQLGKNIEPLIFKDFIADLAKKLANKEEIC